MQVKRYALALFLISILALAQNPARSSNQVADEAKKEEQFQIRRQNFDTGRQLLLLKGVAFDPDELLRTDWTTRLKPALDAMPEMHQSRYETAPLNGAYFADTVYLPEKVQLSGHTLIVANYVVFEGKNPIIKGNFDVHFFPAKPVVVLETTLAQALHKKADLLNVKYGGKLVLPSFSLIQDLSHTGPHNITIDVSGKPPSSTAPQPSKRIAVELKATSWNAIQPPLFPFQKQCTSGCDNNGDPGQTGSPGFSPPIAAIGNPNGGPASPNGSCGSGQSPNGFPGVFGGPGAPGTNAGNGGPGNVGFNSGGINATIPDGDTNQWTFHANGGQGGQGGQGGTGGTGGTGGQGTAGGNGVACECTIGAGGAGGKGGDAGAGGKGGNGGQGGNGGNGGIITVSLPWNSPGANTFFAGGLPGRGGDPGPGGLPGIPGQGGPPGNGATACGQTGSNGTLLGGGNSAAGGTSGDPGPNGQSSGQNGSANVSFRPNPIGGTGGGSGPCDGGDGTGFGQSDGGQNDGNCGSPIIIDTEGEGFHLTSALIGVSFDISGTGHPVQMGWTDSHYHNAFLALPGPDGLIHNGKQLFGNFTPQPQSSHPNGFIALAQYDKPENGGNGDGIIDDRDTVFSQLRLWIDDNHDGVCQPNELRRLPELGIYSLALSYTESRRKDQFGNQFRYKAQVNPGDRKDARDQSPSGDPGRWTYDVFFVVK
jgi:hypothetical protein